MEFSEALRHAGGLGYIPEGALEAARGYMPYYLWIDVHAGEWEDTGWVMPDTPRAARRMCCEACGDDWTEERTGSRWKVTYKQGAAVRCPRCRVQVIARHVTRGFRGIRHQLDAVVYGKSFLNPEAVVAYAVHCEREYCMADENAPWTLETEGQVRGIAVMIFGRGAWRFDRKVAEWDIDGGMVPGKYRWEAVKSMRAMNFGSGFMNSRPERVVLSDTLEDAIEGTPFGRAWHERYLLNDAMMDGLAALSMIAKYPCIEYLTKLGHEEYLVEYLRGRLPAGLLNWRGRDMAAVLRISRGRLGELKGQGLGLTPGVVAVIQVVDRHGVRCGARTAARVAFAARDSGKRIREVLWGALMLFTADRRGKALKYIAKWAERAELSDLRDYWETAAALGGSLAADAEAFPGDFWEAHDRIMKRKKILREAEKDEKIKARYRKLMRKYGFAFGGLMLRPAASAEEVVREGEALHHCVGTYVGSYAEGRTVICVLRRAVEPETPWRTVEIDLSGHVVQDRGLYNDAAGRGLMDDGLRKALRVFWRAWEERGAG